MISEVRRPWRRDRFTTASWCPERGDCLAPSATTRGSRRCCSSSGSTPPAGGRTRWSAWLRSRSGGPRWISSDTGEGRSVGRSAGHAGVGREALDVAFSLAAGRHPAALGMLCSICSAESADLPSGTVVARAGHVPLDLLIGRALAWCVHPVVAWQRLPARGRVLLVAAYVSASYTTVLSLLFMV